MKKTLLAALLVLLILLAGCASAETEAPDLTSRCTISLTGKNDVKNLRDHFFKSYAESKSAKSPVLKISSPEPVYGLYLCFRAMPAYEVQVDRGNGWETVCEGNPDFLHAFGQTNVLTYQPEIKLRFHGLDSVKP